MHMVDEAGHGIRTGFRPDSMAQVEYVTARRTAFLQHDVDAAFELLW